MNKKIGTVEFFNAVKGWGIIKSESESFFVHHSDITDKRFYPINKPNKFRVLQPNQLVKFTAKSTGKTLRAATEVEIVETANV